MGGKGILSNLEIEKIEPPQSACIRYLLRCFDCLAHPNLSTTFATDQK